MSALTDRLRSWVEADLHSWSASELDRQQDETAAADMLDAIDARHQRRSYAPFCAGCDQRWPCADHLILHPEEET